MKTKSLLIALGVLALGLSSCGGEAVSSSDITQESSSQQTPEVSSSVYVANWPAEEIASLVSSLFDSEIAIPSPSEALDEGRTYTVTSTEDSIAILASGDFTAYGEEAMEAGYVLVEGPEEYVGLTHLHDPSGTLAIEVSAYGEEADATEVTIALNGIYYGNWPSAYVEEHLREMTGLDNVAIPPEASGFSYAEVAYGTMANGYPYLDVMLCGYEDRDQYGNAVDGDPGFYPSGFYANASLSSDLEYTVLWVDYGAFYVVEFLLTRSMYITTWERLSATFQSYYGRLSDGNPTALLPEPSLDWDIAIFYNLISDRGYVSAYFLSYDEEGNAESQCESYKDDLDASEEWVYVNDLSGWTDAETNTLMVHVYDISSSGTGTQIILEGGDYSSFLEQQEEYPLIGMFTGTYTDSLGNSGTALLYFSDETQGYFRYTPDNGSRTTINFTYVLSATSVLLTATDGSITDCSLTYASSDRSINGTIAANGVVHTIETVHL